MPRQQTATDDEILQAALRVMVRRGHEAFTLSEVASEVGLSRAAIILRFKGTQALKVTLTTYIVDRFLSTLHALPVSCSGHGLLELVACIGRMIPTPGSLTAFMRNYHANIKDEALARLELRRGEALRAAIAARMPAVAIDHESAVTAFGAHLSGSLMQWEVRTDIDACAYLLERTRAWLRLVGIPHDPEYAAD